MMDLLLFFPRAKQNCGPVVGVPDVSVVGVDVEAELDVAERIQLSLYGREGGPGLPEDVKKMPLDGVWCPSGGFLDTVLPGE